MKATLLLCLALVGALKLALSGSGPEDERAPAPTTDVAMQTCATTDCHGDRKDHRYLHGPLYINACDSCHQLVDAEQHIYQMARPPEQLCLYCHEITVHEGETLHAPLKEGECLSCHDPHGGRQRRILRAGEFAGMCFNCHGDVTDGHLLVHGALAEGACGACHEAHTARNNKLLTSEGQDLCLGCHLGVGIALETSNVTHPPAKTDCGLCHDPHATDSVALLKSDPVTLCIGCHQAIGQKLKTSVSQHAGVTIERGCLNCHDPHASAYGRLLREPAVNLCLECHDRQLEREEGDTIQNIQEVLLGNLVLHAPVAEGNCVACHEIHGGGHERLLAQAYSTKMYNPLEDSTYGLCFSCHDRQLVLLERSDVVTAFRNGDRNLHFVHVNQEQKSRSCHVCHDPHAANREHQLRDSVPFGPTGFPLKVAWEARAEGGTCGAGCHNPLEYNRLEPVTYPEKAPPGAAPSDLKIKVKEEALDGTRPRTRPDQEKDSGGNR